MTHSDISMTKGVQEGSDRCDTCQGRGAQPWFIEIVEDGSQDVRNLCRSCIRVYTTKCLRLRPATEHEITIWKVMLR